MLIPIYILYPVLASIAGVAFLFVVPKEKYKHYLLWGITFGGLGDAATVFLLTSLNLIEYRNMGPFNIFGLFSFFTPITWALVFSLFFYLLPTRKIFLVLYLIAFVGANYAHGLVMEQFNLFRYIGIQRVLAVPTFLVWYGVAALVYRKYGQKVSGEAKDTCKPKVFTVKHVQLPVIAEKVKTRFIKPKRIK